MLSGKLFVIQYEDPGFSNVLTISSLVTLKEIT